jgi:hypothetical protein
MNSLKKYEELLGQPRSYINTQQWIEYFGKDSQHAVEKCCSLGYVEPLERLLIYSEDLYNLITPLSIAVVNGNILCVKSLVNLKEVTTNDHINKLLDHELSRHKRLKNEHKIQVYTMIKQILTSS